LLTVELAAECASDVNEAGALLPAAPPFFELARAGIFEVATFAFLSMSAVEL